MAGLRQALADSIDNRIGDGRSKPSSARCVIWTGPMISIDGSVTTCPGYNKLATTVWVCAKDRFNALQRGKWRPEVLGREITRIMSRLGLSNNDTRQQEYDARLGGQGLQTLDDIDTDAEIGLPLFQEEVPRNNPAEHKELWIQLAFFNLEVKVVELAPNEEKRIPGAIINPKTCEVQVQLNSSAKFEQAGAKLILNPQVDRMVMSMVPRGGGIKIEDYDQAIKAEIGTGANSTRTTSRITRQIENIDWKYRARCSLKDPEVSLEGDLWHEGIRSSITRGLFEVWTDDLQMGPMLRISRDKVKEATARYTRETAAAEQRYATQRDHPGGGEIASSGLTPVKTYINDWFGDPNLYYGLAQFLIQIAAGFDEDGNNFEVNKRTVDLGVFDYGKIYKKYEGVEI